jgi:hypothetical protein
MSMVRHDMRVCGDFACVIHSSSLICWIAFEWCFNVCVG